MQVSEGVDMQPDVCEIIGSEFRVNLLVCLLDFEFQLHHLVVNLRPQLAQSPQHVDLVCLHVSLHFVDL